MIQSIRRIVGLSASLLLSLTLVALWSSAASADITITEPANDAVVRGEITVRFSGIPDGGYAIVKVDGNFMQATAANSFALNTFDPLSFGINQNANTDGQHQVTITGVDASGKNASTASVSFTVANNKVDLTAPSVLLTHWVPVDRLEEQAQRYRIFAESNATISSSQGGGGGGAAMASPEGGAMPGGEMATSSSGGGSWLPSPLDWQYSALLRRVVRDVGLYEGSANIKISIAEAFQRQREGQSGGAGATGEVSPDGMPGIVTTAAEPASQNTSGAPAKAPWSKSWQSAPESGNYFVKTIKPDGEEINATRKKRSIAVTDLLPLFPKEKVQPGSRWETLMTFLSDLSTRKPFNVKVPITFTGFEDIKLPSGEVRHAAKLECRFRLDESNNGDVARKMAAELAVHGGISSGGQSGDTGGAAMGLPAAPGVDMGATSTAANDDAAIAAAEANIATANIRASRVIWFDVDQHRVLRSQDQINTFFEMKQSAPAQSEGGAMPGMMPGMPPEMGMPGETAVPTTPAEPTRVNYTMNVITWFDDTVPAPTDKYNNGKGTAHSKDNVQEPSISKISGKR